jgi:hypothetical protein
VFNEVARATYEAAQKQGGFLRRRLPSAFDCQNTKSMTGRARMGLTRLKIKLLQAPKREELKILATLAPGGLATFGMPTSPLAAGSRLHRPRVKALRPGVRCESPNLDALGVFVFARLPISASSQWATLVRWRRITIPPSLLARADEVIE